MNFDTEVDYSDMTYHLRAEKREILETNLPFEKEVQLLMEIK
jgi:hypothetical protein